jgi:hypothetical protein
MADESPLASLFPANSLEAAAIAQMQKEKQAQLAAQKQQMNLIEQQAQRYGQTGMSDIDKASILFQAAGALSAPTRSGGLMESIGAAGTAVSGPLARAAQAQRDREDKVSQLQMARAKLAGEMGTGDLSGADILQLAKMRADAMGKPSVQERLIDRLGTETDPVKKSAIRAQLGMEAEDAAISETIPAEVRAAGPEAIKKYKEAYGSKVAGEMASAQGAADAMKMAEPILDRAQRAYYNLSQNNAVGPIQASEAWRKTQGVFGAKNEALRQDYEQAAKELELLQAQIKMKGQGTITDSERRILQLTLPRLDAADPKTGLETLRQLKLQMRAAQEKPERIRQRGTGTTEDAPAAKTMSRADQIKAAEEELKRREAQGQ